MKANNKKASGKATDSTNIAIIGGGISGMASAAVLRAQGYNVLLLERNDRLGGRARTWESEGYTFDMGPSWYLMPEVFDGFFERIGKKRSDYYSISKLDPAYRVLFDDSEPIDIYPNAEYLKNLFDGFEKNGGETLMRYLDDASYKYKRAMNDVLYREYRSILDFFTPEFMVKGLRLGVFSNLHRHVAKYFSDFRAQCLLEYAMVFLGTAPRETLSLYSLMSHLDMVQGVYFPNGGIGAMVAGLERLLADMGVRVQCPTEVERIVVKDGRVVALHTSEGEITCDYCISTGDYQYIEQNLLAEEYRNLPSRYWDKAVLAPSMFVLYLGVNKKLPQLRHHNLYFSQEWDRHFHQIFREPAWPDKPSYYLSAVSYDEPSMAPQGKENIFVLVPIAAGLKANDEFLQNYAQKVIADIEGQIGEGISENLEVFRIYSSADFNRDYHAFRGTALGLAHTLNQTAIFRPAMRNKKLRNLFYAGQYTHPGIGMPMCIISAEVIGSIFKKEAQKGA